MEQRRTLPMIAALAFVLLGVTVRPARADVSARPASPGLLNEAERWLTAASAGPTAAGPTAASDPTTSRAPLTAERPAVESYGGTAMEGKPLLGLFPSVSVVARDWHGSMKLAGDRTMLVDDLRPTASNRLVLGRVATDSRLSLFVQAGVGEWRIDRVMFPNLLSYSEVAAQVGTGFELRLSSRLRVASEGQYTMLYKDLHYDGVAPRSLAFLVAVDGRF